MLNNTIRLVECPRDAMQGWKNFIPTEDKIEYLNALLRVGFDTLDCGSFVSPKAIPQMADTKEVVSKLLTQDTCTKLLTIVANARGAQEAVEFDGIHYLGFPFSVSETFQQRNTNSSIQESLRRVEDISSICLKKRKQLVVYISMAFGNPYGDVYAKEIVFEWVDKIASVGIRIISLADTVGLAEPRQVEDVTRYLVQAMPEVEIGVHLHSRPLNWRLKLEAALAAGCRRFDGALKGIGGCPMADDVLVGNMDSELMIGFFKENGMLPQLNEEALQHSLLLSNKIFQ